MNTKDIDASSRNVLTKTSDEMTIKSYFEGVHELMKPKVDCCDKVSTSQSTFTKNNFIIYVKY